MKIDKLFALDRLSYIYWLNFSFYFICSVPKSMYLENGNGLGG